MKQYQTIGLLAAAVLASVTGNAAAAIVGPVTVDFNALVAAATYGDANVTAVGGVCPGLSDCYHEDGAVVGVVDVPSDPSAHFHRAGPSTNRSAQYEADSSGFYVRAEDNSAFGLLSMDFSAPISPVNPGNGPNDYWEILGFDTAVNPNLSSGDGTNYATRVAYETVANGFDGTLVLSDPAFADINAFWIHYHGYPSVPVGADFAMSIDNVNLTAAAVAPVPIPAAAWLFGSGLLGFSVSARRKGRIAAA